MVRSLTLQSNRKAYGPYGVEEGTCFSMNRGKIVGFHGRSGWYLDAIGVYSMPMLKMNHSRTIVHAQTFAGNGSVGESYDIVLAVRQRDLIGNSLPRELSRRDSRSCTDDSSDGETKGKVRIKTRLG